VVTAELVETSRLFARTVARIRPEWVEPAARGLLKRSYSEPFWSVGKGAAMVRERVTLYGLTLAADREVLLGRLGDLVIDEAVAASRSHAPRAGSLEALAAGLVSASKDPLSSGSFEPRHFEELAAAREGTTARELAREMFIRNALVDGQWRERHGFQRRNEALVEQAREVERRSRTHGLVADEQARFRFFDDLIPEHVTSAAAFNRWWKDERRENPDLLIYPASLLMPREATSGEGFPDRWQCGDLSLALSYKFAPGSPRDGVSMRIPIEVLERVSDKGTDWLVPGMREDLLTEAIRALPKGVRRLLAPAPDVAASVARWIEQAGDHPAEAEAWGVEPGCPWGLYDLAPHTGKTHQLRAHLNLLGAPILGDVLYPSVLPDGPDRSEHPLQLLAYTLSFEHPITGEPISLRSGRTLSAWESKNSAVWEAS